MNGTTAERQWLVDEEGRRWFIYRQGMERDDIPFGVTHVLVEEGVTRIQPQAFYTNNELTDDEDDDGKFDSLEVVQIAKTVEEIGQSAFHCCRNLVKVEIPTDSRLSTIRNTAFLRCLSLGDIALPQSLRIISSLGFNECERLTDIYFPPRLETLEECCFTGSRLKEVDLGHCLLVTIIPVDAFCNCYQLETVVLPPNLELIESCAFLRCWALKGTMLFPKTLQQVHRYSLGLCSALEALEFESFSTISAILNNSREARFGIAPFDGIAGRAPFESCEQLHTVNWSRNQGPALSPALWPNIIADLFWSDHGLLRSLPAKNRQSCIFSFLCSIREELMENQLYAPRRRRSRRRCRAPKNFAPINSTRK